MFVLDWVFMVVIYFMVILELWWLVVCVCLFSWVGFCIGVGLCFCFLVWFLVLLQLLGVGFCLLVC